MQEDFWLSTVYISCEGIRTLNCQSLQPPISGGAKIGLSVLNWGLLLHGYCMADQSNQSLLGRMSISDLLSTTRKLLSLEPSTKLPPSFKPMLIHSSQWAQTHEIYFSVVLIVGYEIIICTQNGRNRWKSLLQKLLGKYFIAFYRKFSAMKMYCLVNAVFLHLTVGREAKLKVYLIKCTSK